MSKDKISDYSATANSNTDIGGINIDEGCAPSGINDAIRTLMKQLKDWQSGSQDVYIHPAGSASVPSITATGDTNTGLFFPAADTVGITTGGSERARVDSSGNLGLGVTPSAWSGAKVLEFQNGQSLNSFSSTLYVGGNTYYNGTNYIAKTTAGASLYGVGQGTHIWYNAASVSAGSTQSFTQALTLNANGVLALQGASTSANGVGITFPATQSASTNANTLDDYEEGTWTPTDTSGAGLSFTTATGIYTKIGRLVVASGQVAWPVTANSVSAQVSLPFASANVTSTNYSAGSAMNSANLHLASFVTNNSADVAFYKLPNTSFVLATNANLSNQYIYFTVTYFTA